MDGKVFISTLLSLALIFTSLSHVDGEWTLTIVHTNDVHSRIEQADVYGGSCSASPCFGGMARIRTAVQNIRSSHENVLFLDAGDQFQGTLWFVYYKGSAIKHFMQKLEYDAMTIGNHEFDNGVDGLAPFLTNISFPVVSSNIDASEVPVIDGLFAPSVILDVNGHKVGIIGYTTTETPDIVNPEGVKGLVFEDEIGRIKEEVQPLRDKGAKTIIALGHAGFSKDKEIAREATGVDLVIGGHTNTFLYNGEPPSTEVPVGPYPFVETQTGSGKQVPVVQAYTAGKYLGFLNLTINDEGQITGWNGNPILLDERIPEDPEVLAEVQELAEPLFNLTQTVVGNSKVLLEGLKEVCRGYECNMGNMISDAMVNFYLNRHAGEEGAWTNTAIGTWNSGGIRTSIMQGDFTVADILAVMPFRNTIERIEVYGSTLKQILEHSVRQHESEDPGGEFLQFSGMKVTFNVEREPMDRVVDIQILCAKCQVPKYEPWNKDAVYAMLVSDFLLSGGDGYSFVVEQLITRVSYGDVLADVVMEYTEKYSPISHAVEGRISFVTGDCDNSASNHSPKLSIISNFVLLISAYLTYNLK